MKYEQKPNTGVLFQSEKKSDRHPDYTGNLKLDDGEYLLSAWFKDGKRGKFLSLSVKKKELQSNVSNHEVQSVSTSSNDLPF